MKRLIHTAVLAAALAFALLLCGCSGAETSHKAPQRAAVESGERQFVQPSDGDFIAIFSTSLGESLSSRLTGILSPSFPLP